jgi:hypothetical protein
VANIAAQRWQFWWREASTAPPRRNVEVVKFVNIIPNRFKSHACGKKTQWVHCFIKFADPRGLKNASMQRGTTPHRTHRRLRWYRLAVSLLDSHASPDHYLSPASRLTSLVSGASLVFLALLRRVGCTRGRRRSECGSNTHHVLGCACDGAERGTRGAVRSLA